jgi:pimeloyl-ACP methyl ester carboxylesterase
MRFVMRIVINLVVGILFLLLLLLAAGTGFQIVSEQQDRAMAPGKFFRIGDAEFHLLCKGNGSPAVILESGRGTSSLAWTHVIDGVQNATRVCAYDRLGIGWSSEDQRPVTSANVVQDLYLLIERAQIDTPVILVGWSAGGYFNRKYFERFPEHVAGMILVDSSHEQQRLRLPQSEQDLSELRGCADIAWTGIIRLFDLMKPAVAMEMAADEQLRVFNRTGYCSGLLRVYSQPVIELEDEGTLSPLGSLPLIVIQRGKPPPLDPPEFMEKEQQEWDAIWSELQLELSSLSSDSKHLIAHESGHRIPYEQPGIVSDAILGMVADLRVGKGLSN